MVDEAMRTAIHEAGHAVAHMRFGILQGSVSIIPDDDTLGRASAEESVWCKEDAEKQVTAYCCGYAALIALGFDDQVAETGCDSDFDEASRLCDFWQIGSLEHWKGEAIQLMRQEINLVAVRLIGERLAEHKRLSAEYMDALLDLADGNITESEFDRFVSILPEYCRPG